jgi:hypothetical protein
MALEKAIRRSHKLSTQPRMAEHPIFAGQFPCFKYVPHLLPTQYPLSAPDIVTNRVLVYSTPTDATISTESSKAKRRAANDAQEARMRSHVPELAKVYTGWSDGSVTHEDGDIQAGGATAVYRPIRPDHATVVSGRSVTHVPASLGACSYSTEVPAALALLREMIRAIEEAPPDSPPAALISTDSQSWLSHMATGPLAPGPFLQQCWKLLTDLARHCVVVVLGFKFAHCDDPLGDHIDFEADVAREEALPFTTA